MPTEVAQTTAPAVMDKKAMKKLTKKLGREPTEEEVSKALKKASKKEAKESKKSKKSKKSDKKEKRKAEDATTEAKVAKSDSESEAEEEESKTTTEAKTEEAVVEAPAAVVEEDSDDDFKVHETFTEPVKEDETVSCRDCKTDFMFTVREQEFYESKGWTNKPGRCKDCVRAKKERFGDVAPRGNSGPRHGAGNGASTSGCYNCGSADHFSRECSEKKKCYAFQKGECNYGDSCKFAH